MQTNHWDAAGYIKNHSFVYANGEAVVELLAPQPGEAILDLGCGTGELTAEIAASGATVQGIDASAQMLERARSKYSQLSFAQRNILDIDEVEAFDAVFSNAVLHWIPAAQQSRAMANVYRALRPGGRFVAEFGGAGNCSLIVSAFYQALKEQGADPGPGLYLPTIGAHAAVLEQAGFLVRFAALFPRKTPLEAGEAGMENWLRMFQAALLSPLNEAQQRTVLRQTIQRLRGTWLYDKAQGRWCADYVRLRFVAQKPHGGEEA